MAKKSGSKGCPPPKKTPAWNRYKTENRFYSHKVRKIEKHLTRCPNDKQSASRLQSIKDTRYNAK